MHNAREEKCLRVTKKFHVGRVRTTGCTKKHWHDEQCKLCARIRARKSRARHQHRLAAASTRTPERLALDREASEHRTQAARARAYITKYLKRGAIVPPGACERCSVHYRTPEMKLHAWHPDPTKKRQIAWLCTPCRNYARTSEELVALRWEWPGTALPATKGRPRRSEIDPTWISMAEAAARRTNTRELADALFFSIFSKVAGSKAHLLFRQARRAAIQGKRWCPTGNHDLDARLRAWASFEYANRQSASLTMPERLVEPPIAWERRTRIDRAPLLPPEPPPVTERVPFDQAEYDRKIAAALEKLTAAEAVVDTLLERLTREPIKLY